MPLVINTAPTAEPISLTNVKDHSIVEVADDDTLLTSFISAARIHAENATRRAFITQTWDYYLDGFCDEMILPKAPLQSVSAITYIDDSGVEQTLSAAVYSVDANRDPGRVTLAYNQSWPSTRDVVNAVKITFIAGYGGSNDVPMPIRTAINLLVSHWNENRNNAAPVTLTEIPDGFRTLLSPYEVRQF